MAQGCRAAHGLTAEVTIGNGYPVTVNDADEFAFARGVVTDLFGEDRWADMAYPEAGSEDMSFVLERVPGAYLNVSACAVCRPPGGGGQPLAEGGVRRLRRAGRRGGPGRDGPAPLTGARRPLTPSVTGHA